MNLEDLFWLIGLLSLFCFSLIVGTGLQIFWEKLRRKLNRDRLGREWKNRWSA